MERFDHIPLECYGKWANIVKGEKRNTEEVANTTREDANLPLIQNSESLPSMGRVDEMESQVQPPRRRSDSTMEEGGEVTARSTIEGSAGEELGAMLTRLRSMGMDVTPTVIKKSTDTLPKEKNIHEERGERSGSPT